MPLVGWKRAVLLLALILGVTFALTLTVFFHLLYKPCPQRIETIVQIPRGATVGEIAGLLENRGVVCRPLLFRVYVRLTRQAELLQAGEYRFEGSHSVPDVVRKIVGGEIYYHRVTVMEGLDLRETAQAFSHAGFAEIEAFHRAASDVTLISDLDPLAKDLEGYLFPETYSLRFDTTEHEIVATMVTNLRRVWTAERAAKARAHSMSIREVLTLASLIEKETAVERERSLVSAVFHNRLRLGMKLACDPTVIYAVKTFKEFDGIIHQSDLQLDSPYNTYLYPGLPPGPIANPGERSIDAALEPDEADFLYFVSRNDGTHFFSTSYRDHARAVQRYQRNRR